MRKWIVEINISLILLLLFSCKGELLLSDSQSETVVGFPFVWAMDGINSLEINLSLPGLILNLLINFLVVHASIKTILKNYRMIGHGAVKILMALGCVISVLLWAIILLPNDVSVRLWLHTVFDKDISNISIAFYPLIG